MTTTQPRVNHSVADAWERACNGGPVAQAAVIVAHLQSSPDWTDTTSRRLTEIVTALAARHEALGRSRLDRLDAADARGFVYSVTRRGRPPAIATMHLRRTAVRVAVTVMHQLGTHMDDPTVDLELPAKVRSGHRPLEPVELTMLRVAATSRNRRRIAGPQTVALAEAGATTGEIARLTWQQLDLDSGQVRLPGAGPIRPRTVALSAWGRRSLEAARPHDSDPGVPVVYRGSADPDSDTAQASITSRLARLLTAAGLYDPSLRPGSIRLCLPAARLADGGRIEDAAHTLGLTSLDIAADLLGWEWR